MNPPTTPTTNARSEEATVTVKELIEKLRELPEQDAPIFIETAHQGHVEVSDVIDYTETALGYYLFY